MGNKIATSQGPLPKLLNQDEVPCALGAALQVLNPNGVALTLLELVLRFSLNVTKEPADQALLCPLPSVSQTDFTLVL